VESLFRLAQVPHVSKAQPSSTVFLADCLFASPGGMLLFSFKIEIRK